MARIRMIHPDFIDSISMNNCSDSAQLLFIKMWSVADDDGRLHGDVQWLASRIYPRRTDAAMMLPAWLDELEREGCFFIRESELLRLGPDRRDLRRGASGLDQCDRGIQIFTAASVGVDHPLRCVANGERAVVTSAIPHITMENVKEG